MVAYSSSRNLGGVPFKVVSFDPMVEVREFSDEDPIIGVRPVVLQPLHDDDVVATGASLDQPPRDVPDAWDFQAIVVSNLDKLAFF